MQKTFRENLRDELDYQDMTVKALSAKTGIPKPTLDCYLSSRNTIPPADIAVKIALVLGVTVEDLVLGKKEENKKSVNPIKEPNYKKLMLTMKKLPPQFQSVIEAMVYATEKSENLELVIK